MTRQPELSIVSPCFNEEDNLGRLSQELTRVLEPLGLAYEIIMVENGSSDGSMSMMQSLADNDPHIKIVQLTRNFGYQGGISAGMAHASGRYLVCIDADLQDPVELIPEMYRAAVEGEYDIVYGVRRSRQEPLLQRAAYKLYYRIMRWATPFEIPLDAGDFAVINRQVLDAMLALPEKDRFLRGLRAWVGFRSTGIPYDRRARQAGSSKFSLGSLFLLAIRSVFSFSFVPMRMLFNVGMLICAMIIPLVIAYVIWRLINPAAWPPGIATIVILLLTQIGLTMAGIGLIGEYLAIIFIEVKGRPVYITRRLVNLEPRAQAGPTRVTDG
jgi:dolichol-phosphate mannosyltransferase